MKIAIYHGDCVDVLKDMPNNSIDTLITDPPYGLGEIKDLSGLLSEWLDSGKHSDDKTGSKGFLSKSWDKSVPPPYIWKEIYRVLKPGATALVFAGTRTFDLMALSMKLAGFLHKDTIMFLHSSGFPKALDVSKSIDHKLGAERKVIETIETKSGGIANVNKMNVVHGHRPKNYSEQGNKIEITEATSEEAKLWEGFKSHSIKPAFEPILLMMKPNEGSYADNAIKHGVAGLNIEGARVPYVDEQFGKENSDYSKDGGFGFFEGAKKQIRSVPPRPCRFPSNVIHDGSDEVMSEFAKYGKTKSGATKRQIPQYQCETNTNFLKGNSNPSNQHGDSGSIARFYYCAKASKADRTCDGRVENRHPTVKNRKLMQYLARLTTTPTKGVVLDPFMGSGSTLIGCILEGRSAIGIELEKSSCDTAEERIKCVMADIKSGKKKKGKPAKVKEVPVVDDKITDFEELDMFDD